MFILRKVSACAVLLAATLAMTAEVRAQATDVDCDQCIDKSDISAGAVSKGKLEDKAVTSSKLAKNSVGRDKIKDGAVSLSKVVGKLKNDIDTTCDVGTVVVGKDASGNFVCEPPMADGFVSIAANASYPRDSTTETDQTATDGGGLGRYAVSGGSDFLVAPLILPHGARIVSFSYTAFDNSDTYGSTAWIYTDCSGCGLVSVSTSGTSTEDQTVSSAPLDITVDNSANAYWVYMGINSAAADLVVPIRAVVGYTFDAP